MLILLNTIKKVREFVKEANEIEGDIDIHKGRYTIDGKSELGLFSLPLYEPIEVEIISSDLEEISKFEKFVKKYKVEE